MQFRFKLQHPKLGSSFPASVFRETWLTDGMEFVENMGFSPCHSGRVVESVC